MAELSIGQIVISKRGRDTGEIYVVVDVDEKEKRVKLIHPNKYNVSSPKKKNPAHLQITSRIAHELLIDIKEGKNIDRGFFYRSVGINGE